MPNALRGLRGVTGNFLYVPQCCSVRITKVFFEVPLILLTLLMSLLMFPMSSLVLPPQCPFYPWAGLKGQNVEGIKINQPF